MKIATILAITIIFFSPMAFGQTNTSTSTSTATATSGDVTVNVGGGGGGTSATGGSGGNGGSVSGSGNSHATGGNVSHSGNANQKQKQAINGSGNSRNSYVSEAQQRNPVSTAFAAPLVASGDCMGSTSVGGQGIGLGLSVGSTWDDTDCQRRHDSTVLYNMGYKGASIALMCQSENVAKAMHTAGTPCLVDASVTQETTPAGLYTPSSLPFVRKYPTSSQSNY